VPSNQVALAVLAACALLAPAARAHAPAAPLHFSHPLIAESPSPDTKLRGDAFVGNADEGDFTTFRLEGEYAFTPSLSVEVDVPYTFLDTPDGNHGHFDVASVALKSASFAFAQHGLLLGGGLELGLPTGDDALGIGFDHGVELEPFVDFGWQRERLQVVGFLHVGVPTAGGDQPDAVLGWNLAATFAAHPRVELLLELDGESAFGGEENGTTVVNLTPGVKVKLWRELVLGLGASFPVTHHEEFDVRGVASLFWHF